MVTKVTMPKLAENIEEATVGQWFKGEGEGVAEGEPLFEAITDKAAVEVKAEASGVLRRIYARENSVVPIGQVIGVIAEPDEALPEFEPIRPVAKAAESRAVKASFGARRLAKELGVDLAQVAPARPDGRITEDDVRRAAARTQGPPILQRIPLSPLKRAVASHLSRVGQNVVAASVTLEVDFTAVEAALPTLSQGIGLPVQLRDVVVHCAARVLAEHRLLNACFSDEAILVYQPIHVGLALDVERDCTVLVPVLRDADRKSLAEIARESAGLVERAAAHALDPSEYAHGTFTVADQSGLGIDNLVPVLHERQSAILAVSSVRWRMLSRGGGAHCRQSGAHCQQWAPAPARTANLAVAFDHRVLNATAAARFLHALQERLERLLGVSP
jgi:pyruvate dehydrogenase E2 component (dihydrolipoamide acetyltransferase)